MGKQVANEKSVPSAWAEVYEQTTKEHIALLTFGVALDVAIGSWAEFCNVISAQERGPDWEQMQARWDELFAGLVEAYEQTDGMLADEESKALDRLHHHIAQHVAEPPF